MTSSAKTGHNQSQRGPPSDQSVARLIMELVKHDFAMSGMGISSDQSIEQFLRDWMLVKDISAPWSIEWVLDRLTPTSLQFLFRSLVISFSNSNYDGFLAVVMEYLAKRFLLLLRPFDTRELLRGATILADTNRRVYDIPKRCLGLLSQDLLSSLEIKNENFIRYSIENGETVYEIVGDFIDKTELIIFDETDVFNQAIAFQTASNADALVRQGTDCMLMLATNDDLSCKVYGFYDEAFRGEWPGRFKVAFTAEEEICIVRKTNKISERTISKGKLIHTYDWINHIRIYALLQDLLKSHGHAYTDVSTLPTYIPNFEAHIEKDLRILDQVSIRESIFNRVKSGDKGRKRTKYLLYPGQHRGVCRTFEPIVIEGVPRALHRSTLLSNFMSRAPIMHNRVIEITLALIPLRLPAYVLLWIFEWLDMPYTHLSEHKRIRLIQSIISWPRTH